MSQDKEQALPFFARYLEGQFCEDLSEEEMEAVQGGKRFVKRPFKGIPDDGMVTTLKYPSDHEEGDYPISMPVNFPMTKKYPSDTDESFVTQKYPSDNEDVHVIS